MQEQRIRMSDDVKGNSPFEAFLRALPDTFDNAGDEIHKARNVLKIIDVAGMGLPEHTDRVMVKRYHGLFFLQKLLYSYKKKPKSRRAYDNTAELRRRGIDAARELAEVEVWNHGLYQYAFFVSAVAKGLRLDTILMRQLRAGNKDGQADIIRQFAAFVVRIHEHGILFHDMNPGNVICCLEGQDGSEYHGEGSGNWHFCLIDTNRAEFFDEHEALPIDTCLPDLILMNPKTGIVDLFISEYLKARGLYSGAEAARIREVQRKKYEKKRPVKKFLKRFKKGYYRFLEK